MTNDKIAPVCPFRTRRRSCGRDDARAWILAAEGNAFVWSGCGPRKNPVGDRYDRGLLPPHLLGRAVAARGAWHRTGKRRRPPRE